jgi:hypothetical protein
MLGCPERRIWRVGIMFEAGERRWGLELPEAAYIMAQSTIFSGSKSDGVREGVCVWRIQTIGIPVLIDLQEAARSPHEPENQDKVHFVFSFDSRIGTTHAYFNLFQL